MLKDTSPLEDKDVAGLSPDEIPLHCPLCGEETSKTADLGWRFCSDCKVPIFSSVTEEELLGLQQQLIEQESRVERAERLLFAERRYSANLARTLSELGAKVPGRHDG